MENKKRFSEIDILKAIGIILMVAGHSDAPFTKFIYLFHMAVFFIASGYFFKSESSDNFRSVLKGIWSKVKKLWVPYFVWSVVCILLHNLFIKINVYTDNPQVVDYATSQYCRATGTYTGREILIRIAKSALFGSSEGMFGTSWFIKILFMVSVAYLAADFIAKKVFKKRIWLVQLIASVVLLAFGYWCSLKGVSLYGIALAASYYCLYYLGHVLRLWQDKFATWNWKAYLPMLLVSFCGLLGLNEIGTIALNDNSYKDPIFLLTASLLGWAFLYSIAYFLNFVSVIRNLMIFIGKRTMSVVLLSFLCMKIAEVSVVKYYGLPSFCIAVFPNLYGDRGFWWLAYTIVGVGVPVLVEWLFERKKARDLQSV